MDNLREILGKRVRAFREARGLSQEQLGKAAGLGGKYIGMIERAEKAASFDAIERLAKAFRVDGYELFIPLHRRTDAIERRVRELLRVKGEPDRRVDEFLKVLLLSLRKLD
jgi:transcriptional regulator with XRE-family HTH domain